MAVIRVDNLRKTFGAAVAVDDLSFTAREGAVTGFLGPNGAGKTTTLRMLLGLAAPTAGAATIGGRRYGELPEPVRTVGAVLDSCGFHPGRRARDHLRVLATAARVPMTRVNDVLEQVELADVGQRRIKGFSLGMQQRLRLAGALLGKPEVLILDEPANGLDPEGVRWLRTLLRQIADGGGTVLVSSHLLAEVAQTVDDVIIISRGRLIVASSLTELAAHTRPGIRVRTPHPEHLRNVLARQGIAAEQVAADVVVAVGTTTESVGVAAAGAGAVIYEMTTEHVDLEQVFLSLTAREGVTR
jgi:ABC-2 type transport system ATP-binding protein